MKSFVTLGLIIVLGFFPQVSMAREHAVAGNVDYISGEVVVMRSEGEMPLAAGQLVFSSDTIITGENGRARLSMRDGSTIYIAHQSRINIADYQVKNKSLVSGLFNMLWGKARFVVNHLKRIDASFSVRTSTAVLGVRGTSFIVSQDLPANVSGRLKVRDIKPDPMPTTTLLEDGRLAVKAFPKGGEILLKAGHLALVGTDGKVTIRPYTPEELKLLNSEFADAGGPGTIAPPIIGKPTITVPVVVKPATVQMGTVVIQTGGGRAQTFPTSTTIQVPVSVQPPVIVQVPVN
jgi:hypothetical protein